MALDSFMNKGRIFRSLFLVAAFAVLAATGTTGQNPEGSSRQSERRSSARPVTVPVTIRLREASREKEIQVVDFIVREDGEMQDVISIRRPTEVPLTLALLLQDDLVSSVTLDTKRFADFIAHLPLGSRVMVAYIRSGSLDVRRKFTTDLDKAASSVRPPFSLASAAPFNPYIEIIEALKRFDSQPAGRRAIVVVSDGVDIGRGIDSASPSQSIDLQRAINEAQRRATAIYSLYAPSASTQLSNNQLLTGYGQSSLERLSSETGGRAYFQGSGAPVSFEPFLKDIEASLSRQIALTYLSTHTRKGFHRLEVKPTERGVELRHPSGYTR
jgi:VWFA-related protein